MNKNEKEIKLLHVQLYALIIFIITVFVSVILTYETIYEKKYGKRFMNKACENEVAWLNRVVVTILVFCFFYINYEFYVINKHKKTGYIQKRELIASFLTIISGLILVSTTLESIKSGNGGTEAENPII